MNKLAKSEGRVIVLSGPSGAGKTTLHEMLLQSKEFRGRIVRSISATTRLPRGAEKDGREYFFMSKQLFTYKIRAGHFLEWAKVFGNYYGTPLNKVRGILRRRQSVLLCIDVKGGLQVRKKIPDALLIFVTTSDMNELRHRLEKRGTDSCGSIQRRLKTAIKECAQVQYYDYVIINDNLKNAYEALLKILYVALGKSHVR